MRTLRLLAPLLVAAAAVAVPSARPAEPAVVQADPAPYTETEQAVIRHILERIRQGESAGGASPAEIAEATGVAEREIRALDPARLNRGILRLLREAGRNGDAPESLVGCSLERDLRGGATPEEMALYHANTARDGEEYEGWMAPDFVLPSTSGGQIGLSDLEGRHVALVFVSGHCSHSLEIIRRISALRKEFGLNQLSILGIYVNSGSLEDVSSWTRYLKIDFPLLVAETPELAERFGFQTVPTIFLLDEGHRVRTRLVGEKDSDALQAAFRRLSPDAPPHGG